MGVRIVSLQQEGPGSDTWVNHDCLSSWSLHVLGNPRLISYSKLLLGEHVSGLALQWLGDLFRMYPALCR